MYYDQQRGNKFYVKRIAAVVYKAQQNGEKHCKDCGIGSMVVKKWIHNPVSWFLFKAIHTVMDNCINGNTCKWNNVYPHIAFYIAVIFKQVASYKIKSDDEPQFKK